MNKMLKAMRLAFAVAAVVAVAGCSTMQDVKREAQSAHDSATSAAQSLLDGRISKLGMPARGPVVTDVPFVNVTPVPVVSHLPLAFSRVFTFNAPAGMSMTTLTTRVSALTGLAVSFEPEMLGAGAGAGADPVLSGAGGAWANLPQLPGGKGGAAAVNADLTVAIDYSGSVKGLLDVVAASSKSSWEYDESKQRVNFYRFKTESFRIYAVQGSGDSSARLGGASRSSAGSNGAEPLDTATAEASHQTKESIWAGVEGGIKKLISSEGAYSLSEVAGTVMVRDAPARLDMVRKFIDETNTAMSRQVDVEVTVYRVMTTDKDTRGLNWKMLFQDLIATSAYGFDLTSVRPDVIGDGLTSAIISVKETDENGVPHRYGGSQMFIDALSRLGKASVVTNTSVIAQNNQPAPVKVVRRTSYLAETTPTYIGGTNNAVSTGAALTPGTVETGLNLYLLPHVMDDGKRMLLKLMVSLSTLEDMTSYSNGDASIQLPQVASREFQQQAWLNSGETLVLAGFEQVDSGLDTQTPFDKNLWLLGGNRTTSKAKEMVVVAIRPVVTAARSRI